MLDKGEKIHAYIHTDTTYINGYILWIVFEKDGLVPCTFLFLLWVSLTSPYLQWPLHPPVCDGGAFLMASFRHLWNSLFLLYFVFIPWQHEFFHPLSFHSYSFTFLVLPLCSAHLMFLLVIYVWGYSRLAFNHVSYTRGRSPLI